MDIYKPAKNWKHCKKIAFEYWGIECLYSKIYTYNTKDIWFSLLQQIDPAHVFGCGANHGMKLIPANVIPLNRYVHSLIDDHIDPQTCKPMAVCQRTEIFHDLLGDVYFKLCKIKRGFYKELT